MQGWKSAVKDTQRVREGKGRAQKSEGEKDEGGRENAFVRDPDKGNRLRTPRWC
jgi:hypothetical protein